MEPPQSRDLLNQMLRKAQRTLARTDPAVFIEYITGMEPAAHHRVMLDFAMDIIARKARGIVLAPRGSGKTTILNTGLLPWLVAINPDIRIGLLSQKAEKAEAMSSAIKNIVAEQPEFLEIFGSLRGQYKWSDSEWLRKDSRHYTTKDRTMVAAGADQASSVVSKRFDLIFADDILDENNTYTIDRREKLETWFWKTLKPTQAAEGCAILVVGTRWVEDDLYQKLIENNKWPSLIIPAIDVDEQTDEEKSYWPAVWPLERLYAEREDVGWDNFACSYLNRIDAREGVIFRRDWWRDTYFEDLPVDRSYTFTMGVDLATSERQRADYTTYVIAARDDRGEHWVLHHDRLKTTSGHTAFVRGGWQWAHDRGYEINKILIENNQAQEALVALIQREEPDLPIIGRRTDTDKRQRALGIAPRYESHRVHHHINLRGRELETEMLGFPKGHDDLVDALGLAMDLGSVSGSIAGVHGRLRGSEAPRDRLPLGPEEVPFLDGPRIVPAHVLSLLRGLDTETMRYDDAIAAANTRRVNDYTKSLLHGILPR